MVWSGGPLAACRAAYDRWAVRADTDLTLHLDAELRALAVGFATESLPINVFGGAARPQPEYPGWLRRARGERR